MARNWKVGEAVRAIQAGNKEDILDIGRRFPLFANLAAKVNEAGAELLDCVPDYCTARKIESVLKGDVQETEDDEAAAEDEAPAKAEKKAPEKAAKKAEKKPAKKAAEDDEDEDDDDALEGKSAKELFKMCKDKGIKVKPGLDKAAYIKALNAAEETESEDEEDWEEEEAPKKPAKAEKKAAPKAKPKKNDEEDDDWDV